jgi:hypothetical protein
MRIADIIYALEAAEGEGKRTDVCKSFYTSFRVFLDVSLARQLRVTSVSIVCQLGLMPFPHWDEQKYRFWSPTNI